MRRNRLKEQLATGDVALGTLVWDTRTRGAIHTLAAAGMDFVVICMEHSAYNLETVAELVGYAHAAGITPVVRLPTIDAQSVTRVLDCGCQSLIAPRVEDVADVERFIRLAKYHPEGERGAAIQAYANTDYEDVAPAAAMQHANANTLLGVIVERRGAVEQLDAILGLPLDVVIVGKQDLAQSYGLPGQWTPALEDIYARVGATARARGIAVGAGVRSAEDVARAVAAGAQFLLYGSELVLLRDAAGRAVDAVAPFRRS